MIRAIVLSIAFALCSLAQQPAAPPTAPAEVAPETVVAVLNGKKLTAGEIQRLVAVMPSQVQAAFKADPKEFLRQHAYYLRLEELGLKNKVDQHSPTKEQLEFARMMIVSQAFYNQALRDIEVTPEEQRKYYDANAEVFREAKVRMIYLPFSDLKSEGDAKSRAEALVTRAKAGEDFAKLSKEAATDSSAEEFAVRMDSSQPPPPMRRAILALKKGEVTDALRHDNGYYIFRVESADVLPFEKVRDDIYKTIRDSKFRDWERQAKSQISVQFENEVFFQKVGKE